MFPTHPRPSSAAHRGDGARADGPGRWPGALASIGQRVPPDLRDAIVVNVRDGQVSNTPFYAAMGITIDGKRDIPGIWAGDGTEGARLWLQLLTELKPTSPQQPVCNLVPMRGATGCDDLMPYPDRPRNRGTGVTKRGCGAS